MALFAPPFPTTRVPRRNVRLQIGRFVESTSNSVLLHHRARFNFEGASQSPLDLHADVVLENGAIKLRKNKRALALGQRAAASCARKTDGTLLRCGAVVKGPFEEELQSTR